LQLETVLYQIATGDLNRSVPDTLPSWKDYFQGHCDPTTEETMTNLIQKMRNDSTWIRNVKPCLSLVVDNGPDFAPSSLQIFYHFGKLWIRLKIDVLILVSYAAYQSASNPIEKNWFPLTSVMAGRTIRLPPNGQFAPAQTPGKTAAQVEEAEVGYFNDAMLEARTTFGNARINGKAPITHFYPVSEDLPFETESFERYMKASKRKVDEDATLSEINDAMKFLSKHCIRRNNLLIFYRCEEGDCKHCFSELSEVRAVNVLSCLRSMGNFEPRWETQDDGGSEHYQTFRNAQAFKREAKKTEQPSFASCDFFCEFCPDFMATSETELKFHHLMIHPDRRRTRFVCNWKIEGTVCGCVFDKQASLSRHKKAEKHYNPRVSAASTDENDSAS
jgi:hypothetical protein